MDAQTFWTHVDCSAGPDACWPWRAARFAQTGYGAVRWDGRAQSAARIAYLLAKGSLAEGLHVDHLCRDRACCNPAHLEAVSQRENILRGTGFSARNAAKAMCPQGHPYSGVNLRRRRGAARLAKSGTHAV